jgi:hypothetical protein
MTTLFYPLMSHIELFTPEAVNLKDAAIEDHCPDVWVIAKAVAPAEALNIYPLA